MFCFDSLAYGEGVARILAFGGDGHRPMPLAGGSCSSPEAAALLRQSRSHELFPRGRSPQAAMSGLWLYFSCMEEAHSLSQDLATPDGSFWHGILHRQEPDPGNASYWFSCTGPHPIYPALREGAMALGYRCGARWDPFAFIDYCERARREPGSETERLAMRIQLLEWQLLFDHCAGRPADA